MRSSRREEEQGWSDGDGTGERRPEAGAGDDEAHPTTTNHGAANCASLTGLHRGKTYCCARKTKENAFPEGTPSAKVTD